MNLSMIVHEPLEAPIAPGGCSGSQPEDVSTIESFYPRSSAKELHPEGLSQNKMPIGDLDRMKSRHGEQPLKQEKFESSLHSETIIALCSDPEGKLAVPTSPQKDCQSALPPSPPTDQVPRLPQEQWMLPGSGECHRVQGYPHPGSPDLYPQSRITLPPKTGEKRARPRTPTGDDPNITDQPTTHLTNDAEAQEPKRPKRALRNRQSAVDAQQRQQEDKERLMRDLVAARLLINQSIYREQEQERYIRRLEGEMEEMLRAYSVENDDLRMEVQFLTKEVRKRQPTLPGIESLLPPQLLGHLA